MKQRIDIHQFVSLTATAPAKLYGLYPRKGTISPGGDADIVIWNTDLKFTLSNSMLHHNVDYTPYEGMELNAWPTLFCREVMLLPKTETVRRVLVAANSFVLRYTSRWVDSIAK